MEAVCLCVAPTISQAQLQRFFHVFHFPRLLQTSVNEHQHKQAHWWKLNIIKQTQEISVKAQKHTIPHRVG